MSNPNSHQPPATPTIAPCGDAALTVEFAQAIDGEVNARVRALDVALTVSPLPGLIETMQTYGSLLVSYDPTATTFAALAADIMGCLPTLVVLPVRQTGWCLPVVYGGATGFDLDQAAQTLDLDTSEVVRRHVASRFQIFMIGFLPGFTYLGGLDQSIALPRRPIPRPQVPAGSIVIGGIQTAIGSIAGPSGWHVIGRTPVRAFMPGRDPAFFMMPGDRIVLESVPASAFDRLAAHAARGTLVAEPIL